jgi:NAD(P)-dependent dehydrogenase (short-subunit alcohol dehydrogenase family)
VDIFANNAGAAWATATEDHPIEAWDKLMNRNIRFRFLLSQRIGKLSMIPKQVRPHYQYCIDCRSAWRRRRHSNNRLSKQQGRGGEFYPCIS